MSHASPAAAQEFLAEMGRNLPLLDRVRAVLHLSDLSLPDSCGGRVSFSVPAADVPLLGVRVVRRYASDPVFDRPDPVRARASDPWRGRSFARGRIYLLCQLGDLRPFGLGSRGPGRGQSAGRSRDRTRDPDRGTHRTGRLLDRLRHRAGLDYYLRYRAAKCAPRICRRGSYARSSTRYACNSTRTFSSTRSTASRS